jgi:hypothetical protein
MVLLGDRLGAKHLDITLTIPEGNSIYTIFKMTFDLRGVREVLSYFAPSKHPSKTL